jgi:hypothetical protein
METERFEISYTVIKNEPDGHVDHICNSYPKLLLSPKPFIFCYINKCNFHIKREKILETLD